jgi:hypothetical protein
MAELLLTPKQQLRDQRGRAFRAEVWGEAAEDGRWTGWLEFVPVSGRRLRTGSETVQPSRASLLHWAGGLEPVYLEAPSSERLAASKEN